MNCVIYARVSTEQQADRELSIPAQLQAAREYATRQGWSVLEEFIEPGVSARTAQRPVLQGMLKRCREKPKVDVVVVHKIDRLARSVYDHALIRYQLTQHQIKLASVVENVDDSISGQLVEHIMAAIAEFYSGNLGQEVKKGMRMLVEKGGWPHLPPRGYKVVRDDNGRGHVEPDDDAPLIQHAFERYASGLVPLHDLRLELAEKGFTTSRGQVIPLASVHRLLQNPFYAGRVRWNGLERPGVHPALVSENLFLRVQATLKQRHRDTGEKGRLHFLLRGVAMCGACGAKMTAERHRRWAYYRCVNHTITRDRCSSRFSKVELAHQSVSALFDRLRLAPELKEQIETAAKTRLANQASNRQRHLRSLRMKQAKLDGREVKITEAYAGGEVSLKAYRAALLNLRTQLAAVEVTLTEVDADPTLLLDRLHQVLAFASSLQDLRNVLDERGHAGLLRTVFKRIDIEEGAVVGYALQSPFDRLLVEESTDGTPKAGDLEDIQVTPTIEAILEFDVSRLNGLTHQRKRAA